MLKVLALCFNKWNLKEIICILLVLKPLHYIAKQLMQSVRFVALNGIHSLEPESAHFRQAIVDQRWCATILETYETWNIFEPP